MADPHPPDRGFTLTEVIVVMLMVGVLSTVIVAVIAVINRNVPSTEARADDTRSYQRLLEWLPPDAASTPPGGFVLGSAPTCVGGPGGVNLVTMRWQAGGEEVREYWEVDDGGGAVIVRRSSCSAPGYADTETIDLTSRLDDATAALQGGNQVTLTLSTCGDGNCTFSDGTITVAATSRNPANTLPSGP